MVRVELGKLIDRHPFQIEFLAELVVVIFHVDERAVGHGDHSFSRVTVYGTKGTHLFHI